MNKNLNINLIWLIKHPISFIAFGFGIGLIKKAPGTFGSLLGLIIALIFYSLGLNTKNIFYISVILLIIGFWICHYSELELHFKDYKGIVWDEISSMIFVLSFTPLNYLYWILAFILFRIFDILKPWPIKIFDEKLSGGIGIMLDDIISACFSICILKIIIILNLF